MGSSSIRKHLGGEQSILNGVLYISRISLFFSFRVGRQQKKGILGFGLLGHLFLRRWLALRNIALIWPGSMFYGKFVGLGGSLRSYDLSLLKNSLACWTLSQSAGQPAIRWRVCVSFTSSSCYTTEYPFID